MNCTPRAIRIAVGLLALVCCRAGASEPAHPPVPLLADLQIVDFPGLHRPSGVASLESGQIAVADEITCRIEVFTPTGAHMWGFGGRGSTAGLFGAPSDLARAADGTLLVADPGNMRVQRVNELGDVLATYESTWAIQRILATSDNGYLAARSYLHGDMLVDRYSSQGEFIHSFGERLTAAELGVDPNTPFIDASLNNFCWGPAGPDDRLPVAFASLGIVHLLDPKGGPAVRFTLPPRALVAAHRTWHEAKISEFAAGGRAEMCSDVRPEVLAQDLATLSLDGKPHLITMITGVGFLEDRWIAVADGIVYVSTLDGEALEEYALLDTQGGLAYSHRLSFDADAPTVVYSVDTAHRPGVYLYRLPN